MNEAIELYYEYRSMGVRDNEIISEVVAQTGVHRGQFVRELMSRWLEEPENK